MGGILAQCWRNVEDVSIGVGLDQRIGSRFIRPGPAYGCSCFPKDTNALLHFMKSLNSPHKVLEACVCERDLMRKD